MASSYSLLPSFVTSKPISSLENYFNTSGCAQIITSLVFVVGNASRRTKIFSLLTLVSLLCLLFLFSGTLDPSTFKTLHEWHEWREVQIDHPSWLIATISPYFGVSRRQIIRSTWQTLYKNSSITDFRFVISNPDPTWDVVLEHENATYGDLIALRHLEENNDVANTIKTVEFFKYLLSGQEKRWTFVTKVDDDSYLDARQFYQKWLEPMINNSTNELVQGVPEVTGIVIGKGLRTKGKDFTYPSGQFYTLSWDMVKTMAEQQEIHNVTTFEDVLVGELLQRGHAEYKLMELPYTAAFEIALGGTEVVNGKATAWAANGTELNAWFHPVGPGSINPHRMKKDEDYLLVAQCFGPHGPQRPGTGPPNPIAN
jgi:hypothetical protein